MDKTTITGIARTTGFSISTISRVLNGKAEKYRISKKTVQIIEDEAQRCNYSPSMIARGLRTNKTHTIGLVVPCIDNPFFANVASVIVREAKNAGYTIVLMDSAESERGEAECVRSLLSHRIDGMIVVPCGTSPEHLERIDREGVPVVLVDRYFENTVLPYVSTDNFSGAYEATEHLIGCGHRRIVCLQGIPSATPTRNRVAGYRKALADHGLADNALVVGNDFSVQNGYGETKLLLTGGTPPTALFALSNTIALGAYKAIREAGLTVPHDLSLVCFDNYMYLDFLEPPVTRVAQPIDEIGVLAIKILLRTMEKRDEKPGQLLLPPTLLLAKSVRQL